MSGASFASSFVVIIYIFILKTFLSKIFISNSKKKVLFKYFDNNGDVVLDPNNSKLLFLRYTRSKIAIRDNATIMLVIMLVDDIELEFFEFCFINILFYSILLLYN